MTDHFLFNLYLGHFCFVNEKLLDTQIALPLSVLVLVESAHILKQEKDQPITNAKE